MRRVERTQSRGDRRGSAEDYLRQQHECIQVREPLGREANIFLCATSAVSASLRVNYHFASLRTRGRQGLAARCAGFKARGAAEIAEAAQRIIKCIQVRMLLGREANMYLCATSVVSASLRVKSITCSLCERADYGIGGAMRRVERARSRRDRRGSAEDYLRQQHECIQVREPLGREANIFLCATSAVSASLRVNYHFASLRAHWRQGLRRDAPG